MLLFCNLRPQLGLKDPGVWGGGVDPTLAHFTEGGQVPAGLVLTPMLAPPPSGLRDFVGDRHTCACFQKILSARKE